MQKANLKSWLAMSIILVALAWATAAAQIIYIDDDGPADFNNIQDTINDSNAGDIIEVQSGTKTGIGTFNITVSADAYNQICESDENDKSVIRTYQVPEMPTTAGVLYDFIDLGVCPSNSSKQHFFLSS